MVNTHQLRELVQNFAFLSRPSNADASAQCTVQDINKVVQNVAALFNAFIDEMEKDE